MLSNICIFVLLCICVNGDIYLTGPRGSNNRLDGANRDRRNAQRLFDSQNNARGGYNVGSLYYYTGSELTIEWTNQHSCAEKNSHCEIIIQYMCNDQLRDGITTRTIPAVKSQCAGYNCNTDVEYGMQENYDHYMNCKYRRRNNLFTYQKLRSSAIYTRQNPKATRYAYECPEERDYYPHWHPSPWRDIAVLTNNVSRCEMYQKESQNVKSKFSCVPPHGVMDEIIKGRARIILPITKQDCEKLSYPPNTNNTFKWVETKAHGLPPPECKRGPRNRDNHLGNGVHAFANMFNWTIPNTPHEFCALRIRYNISTADYNAWPTNATDGSYGVKLNIASLVGIKDATEASTRGYVFKDNPVVQPLGSSLGSLLGKKLQLQLNINTNQYGRTFQDRSHSFSIRKRPSNLNGKKIHNVNVRGKRGNIVQVYPAVEYDFIPNRVLATTGDYIHLQWTGSNTNPRNNDGQGLAGTDRSNIAVLRPQNYPEGTPGKAVPKGLKFGHWGNNYPSHLDNTTFLGFSRTDLEHLAVLAPGQFRGEMSELDDAGTYFDLGPRKVTRAGTYHYMCTRNNNFSNRSQKGKIIVGTVKSSEKEIGWSGGVVSLDGGKQGVWIPKGAISDNILIRVEEWSKADGQSVIKSQGGGNQEYESNFLAVFPFVELFDGSSATFKLKVPDSEVEIYHSIDYLLWRAVRGVTYDGGVATFQAQKGGIYVGRKAGSKTTTTTIVVVLVLLILVAIIVGSVFYCRKRPDTGRKIMTNIHQTFQNKV